MPITFTAEEAEHIKSLLPRTVLDDAVNRNQSNRSHRMKARKFLERLDEATTGLLNVHSALRDNVQSADGAKAVAAMMLPLIDELIVVHGVLCSLKDARVKNGVTLLPLS